MRKTILVITIAALTFLGKAYAEVTYGISAAFTKIDASGTETEGGENNSATATNTVLIPSVFAEFAYTDTIAIGLDFIPFKADVSNKTKSRQDTESSVTGTATHVGTSRTQRAQAELENHLTLYANYMFSDNYFVKGGIAMVTLNTKDSLDTGSKYGNEDVFGGVFGIGAKNDNHRFELIYTDYEDISLTSSVARTGVTTNNTINADLDTLAFKYSYAF
tara:strand:+ start:1797 stop:2453 length:657 start_codon:yes stop_codon:yes gene_type:complete